MFKSHTKFLVLQELRKHEQSGYDLMRSSRERGIVLSPGYLYPLLQELEKSKHISVKAAGRRKIYTLTARGKKLLQTLQQTRESSISTMLRTIEPIADKKEVAAYLEFINQMQQYKQFMLHDMDLWQPFHNEICARYASGAAGRKKVRSIIKTATIQLRKRS